MPRGGSHPARQATAKEPGRRLLAKHHTTMEHPAFTLGALCTAGGLIGFLRKGSIPSLAGGLAVGGIYGAAGYLLRENATGGLETALLGSVLLLGAGLPRAIKLRKPVPMALTAVALLSLGYYGKNRSAAATASATSAAAAAAAAVAAAAAAATAAVVSAASAERLLLVTQRTRGPLLTIRSLADYTTWQMKLKEIQRTATFAWSPRPDVPLLVSGHAAGAIDADFSASTSLELWQLDLTDRRAASFGHTQPAATLDVDARFYDLDFSADGYHVAGALENGNVDVWAVEQGREFGLKPVYSGRHPNGTAHVVSFNRQAAHQFASGGANGQILIWDLERMSSPASPSSQTSRTDDVTDLAFNKRVAHILASTGRTGFTSIWDLNKRREVIHLHYTSAAGHRLPVSSMAWHPSNSTKLATASMDDQEPVILTWDLRNASVPEKVLRGHSSGVLSLDWCAHDEQLLLSSGRDNRTLLWDPSRGEMLGEYPVSVGWAFKTRFHPHLPDVFATATLDEQIVVQTLQDTGSTAKPEPVQQPAGDDFWAADVVMDTVHPTFTLQHPPAWLQRPVSAKFGFGGKLVVAAAGKVKIEQITDDSLGQDTKAFAAALQAGDLASILEPRQGADWDVLAKLVKSPSELLAAETEEEDADEFDVAPQYDPEHDFTLLDGAANSVSDRVTKLVLGNQQDKAVRKLIAAGEPADALLLASYSKSPELLAAAQNAYLAAVADTKPYLRAAWAVAGNRVEPLAGHTELDAWPHTLRAVLASQQDIAATSKVLGDRLLQAGRRNDAVTVYLAGANVGAAAAVWLSELPALQREIAADNHTAYAAHVKAIQQVMEKILVAQRATNVSAGTSADEAENERLFEAFRDYAQIASSQGELALAKTFLDMLPAKYHQDKQRVTPAATRASSAAAPKSPYRPYGKRPANTTLVRPAAGVSSAGYGLPPAQPAAPAAAAPPAPSAAPSARFMGNPYAHAANPYAAASTNPYAQPAAAAAAPAPAPAAVPPPPAASAFAPPRATAAASIAASAAAPAVNDTVPPSAAHRPPVHGWNDLPEISKPVRRTPVAPQIITPRFATASPAPQANQPPPKAGTRRTNGTAPSPQLAAAAPPGPPPVASPGAAPGIPAMLGGSPAAPVRHASNPYAPPPAAAPSAPPGALSAPVAFTPPVAAPLRPPPTKPNPYAAAAAAPMSPAPAPAMPGAPPMLGIAPPTAATPTYGNRIASGPLPPAAAPAAAPPAAVAAPPPPGPARAPPKPAPSAAAAATAAAVLSSPVPAPAAASQPLYPPGDREHIPPQSQGVYATLRSELDRVQPVISAQYPKQYKDTARRLDLLFDLLNNDNVLDGEALAMLGRMTGALEARDFDGARAAQVELHSAKSEQCGQWMTGVKRLIDMAAAIPA